MTDFRLNEFSEALKGARDSDWPNASRDAHCDTIRTAAILKRECDSSLLMALPNLVRICS